MQGGGWARGEGAGPEQRQLQTQEQNETLQPPHQTNQTKPNQTKPNQTKPTKPNQTKPNHTNQTKPNQTKPNNVPDYSKKKKKNSDKYSYCTWKLAWLDQSRQTLVGVNILKL